MRIADPVAGALGWATAAFLALLALGGAAATPEGVLQGVPHVGEWIVVGGLTLAVAAWAGAAAGRTLLGLSWVPLALGLAPVLPGAGALSGPPLLALVAAGAAAVLAQRGWHPPPSAFLPAVLALYACASLRAQQLGPRGDEPHYLMVADSLLRDGDLSLEEDYAEGRYQAFHPEPLAPHYRVRGKSGEVYSLHAVGLSLMILPAYALGGYPAVSFFMALLAALLAREVRELVRAWTGADRLAEGVGWVVALSPPLLHYAGLVFTEVPAALAVAFTLRAGRRLGQASLPALFGWATVLALLPWLNVRYAALAAVLLAYALAGRPGPRQAAALVVPALVSPVALALHHWRLYGFYDPRLVYGRRPEFSLAALRDGLPGLFLDQEFGLLVYAPVFALAVPGVAWLLRHRRREALAGVCLLIVSVGLAGSWYMWRGGWNPPARFLVPVLPVLAGFSAAALRGGLGAAPALLIGWGLWTGLSGAWEPRLVHRDREGSAPFFRARSGAEEWTRLLPSYVLAEEEPDRHRLALVWGGALALAVLARRRPVGGAGLALVSAGLLGAAVAASVLSDARTRGRDAVRVVGRPAVALPAGPFLGSAPARWGATTLGWGPLYESHRHPGGAELGDRLPLPAGRYWVRLDADVFSGERAPPALVVKGERGAPAESGLERTAEGWAGFFEVPDGSGAVSLLLKEGGALFLKEIRLSAQPLAPPPV